VIIRFHSAYYTMYFGKVAGKLPRDLWDEWKEFCRRLWEQSAVDASLYQGGIMYQTREAK